MKFDRVRVLIFQQRGWARRIGHPIARGLHRDGAILGALTFKKSTDAFVRHQTEVPYEVIVSHDAAVEDPAGYLDGDDYPLGMICHDLGIDSVWPLVQSLRNHVRSYHDKYYYGFRQEVPDEEIVLYVKAVCKLCRTLIEDFAPAVIVTPNFVSFPHIVMNMYAKKRGVEMIGITDSKVQGITMFTTSYVDDTGPFIDRLNELEEGATSPNHDRAAAYVESNRKRLLVPTQMLSLTRSSRRERYKRLFRDMVSSFRRQNRLDGIRATVDHRRASLVLRDFRCHHAFTRAANAFPYVPFDTLGSFAFMPLQFQPEATIDVVSPRFNNQIETARQVAMSLPGDMTLVVKDHPAMLGYRSPSYLEKVARTPNVKLIDYRIPTEQILRKTALVIGASGTVFAEAAFLNTPVIQLGQLGTTKRLPNVFHHTDFSTLSAKVKTVLGEDLKTRDYERGLTNYVAAAYDIGLDIDYFGIWERDEDGDMTALYEFYSSEIERALGRACKAERWERHVGPSVK